MLAAMAVQARHGAPDARAADPCAAGAAALEGADWEGARSAFEAVLAASEVPGAREGLGQALWFLGLVPQALHERERAFDGYVTAGAHDDAARLAVWLSHQQLLAGRPSAARGWLARAERVLEGQHACCPGRGWVAVERARHATRVQEQVLQARRAMRIARTTGAVDLEVFALSLLGRTVVSSGRREEGLALLEEALTAASSGRVRDVHVLAEAYCNLIEGCAAAGEWERGAQWCEVVEQFALSHRAAPLFGACQTVHASVLVATGDWPGAEVALRSAVQTHARHVPQMGAPAVEALAELRVRQGRLREAEALLDGGGPGSGWLRVMALLRLADGRAAEAVTLLERALREGSGPPVRTAQVLVVLAEARLADADVAGAHGAAQALAELAGAVGIPLVGALADLVAARAGDVRLPPGTSALAGQRAVAGFERLRMPYELSQARLALAHAVREDAPAVARDQAEAARAGFAALGAGRGRDAADELLRGLGRPTVPRSRTGGELTAREQEVLELIAVGASNAGIAAALCISTKTAGHHVSHILTKLGARNRTEAAARAGRLRAPT